MLNESEVNVKVTLPVGFVIIFKHSGFNGIYPDYINKPLIKGRRS